MKRGKNDRISKIGAVVDDLLADWPTDDVTMTVYGLRSMVEGFFQENGQLHWLRETFNVRGLDTIVSTRLAANGYRKMAYGWMPPRERAETYD